MTRPRISPHRASSNNDESLSPSGRRTLAPPLLLATALVLLGGCGDGETDPPGPPPPAYLLVLNSLGETLDRIDLDTGVVEYAITPTGNAPNDLLVDAVRNRAWVANSGDNSVAAFDLATLGAGPVALLGPNSNPWALARLTDGGIAVTNWLSGDVAWIDPQSGAVGGRIPVGRAPQALIPAPDPAHLLVTLVQYDFPSGRFGPGLVQPLCPDCGEPRRPAVAVGTNPQTLVLGPDGGIHVVCTGNYGGYAPTRAGEIHILDPTTYAPRDTIALGGSPDRAAVAGNFVYVSALEGLLKYDGVTHAVINDAAHPILNASTLGGLVVDEARHRLYVTGFTDDLVYVLDTLADTLVTAWEVGDGPVTLARVEVPTGPE